jgi:hypothetical protein
MLPPMSRTKILLVVVPVGHAILFTGYYLWSRDAAGTAMSVMFAIAMGLMIYILLPTVRDVGPTAPVDNEWAERAQPTAVEHAERT